MGMRSSFDPNGIGATEVDKVLGTAYEVVRAVSEKLPAIQYLAENIDGLTEQSHGYRDEALDAATASAASAAAASTSAGLADADRLAAQEAAESAQENANLTEASRINAGESEILAQAWADLIGAPVTPGLYSAKEWATGAETRGDAGGGSAKDWANYVGGPVDATEYSAKKYAQDAATSLSAAEQAVVDAEAAVTEAQLTVPPVQVADYTALRAITGVATRVDVTGYLVSAAPSGIAGTFVRDDTDTTSTDNGGTVIVVTSGPNTGKRFKRAFASVGFFPEWFGAIGNGVANDTAAISACYTAARSASTPVQLKAGASYFCNNGVDGTGVSTIGMRSTLLFTITPAAGYAFRWGGANTYVAGVTFDLSNSDTSTSVQGVINSTNDVKNQRFFNNRLISRTRRSSTGRSNIYGAWFTGTGLKGLHIYGNYCEATDYGIQINNQDGTVRDVNTDPLGNPSRGIHITDNICLDAMVGVNTPHNMVSDVRVEGNTIWPEEYTLDLPLNIAHVTGITVSKNKVTCNAAGSNGSLHIEDVTGAAVVTGNVIRTLAANSGITLGIASGISHDNNTTTRLVVTDNHVLGPGIASAGTGEGIVTTDTTSIENIISGNHVSGYYRGITSTGANGVSNNTIQDCQYGIVGTSADILFASNTLRRCTYNYRCVGGRHHIVQGGALNSDDVGIEIAEAGTISLRDVLLRKITPISIAAATPFTVLTLPNGKFSGEVTIYMGTEGYSQHTIVFDGTTFTATRVADWQIGSLGGMTLSKSGSLLQATISVGNASNITLTISINKLAYHS